MATHVRNMADSWGKAREEVTCAICSCLFIEPKILPCLHTFCMKCIQGVWKESSLDSRSKQEEVTTPAQRVSSEANTRVYTKSQKEKKNVSTYKSISKKIECSLCSGKFTMTSAKIETLPANTAAHQLVELVTMYEQLMEKTPPSCQLCENDSKAISSCLQCNILLCAACEFTHKRLKLTSTHQINCLDDIKSGKVDLNSILDHKQELCSVHPDKCLELFCKNESCFICLGCAVVKHRDHQYDFISQVVEEQQEEIKSIFPSIQINIEQLEHARAKVETTQQAIQLKRKQNIEKIERTFSKIETALMKRKQQLLDEVSKISEDRINTLCAQQKQLDSLYQQMKKFLSTAKATVTSGRKQTVLDMKNPIMERNKSLVAEKNQTDLKPSQSVQPDIEFHTLDSIIALVDQLATIPDAKGRAISKTISRNGRSEYTLTLKDPMGKPISGCAGYIEVLCSNKPIRSYYPTLTTSSDSHNSLKVNDIGKGEYTFFNMCNPSYCSSCHSPLNSDLTKFCLHCGCKIPACNQYVSVFINQKQISESSFNYQQTYW